MTGRRLILATACLGLWSLPASARDYSVCDVVGDSISAGVNPGCGELYGWVDMLGGEAGCGQPAPTQTIYTLWPTVTVYNSAVSGSTAKDWAWQQPSYLAAVSNHHPDLVVVLIGGNDGLAYAADGVYTEAEKEEFRTNLITIVQKLRNNTPAPEIVMVNYYDFFDGLSTNLPPAYSAYRAFSAAVIEGSRRIEGTATSNGCFFTDIHGPMLHHGYGAELGDTQHLSPDFFRTPLSAFDIHPVTAGHEEIRRQVWLSLAELKEIPKFVAHESSTNRFVIRWRSAFGQAYVVERSTDLIGGFADVATNAGTPTVNVFTDAVEGLDRAFYRIRAE